MTPDWLLLEFFFVPLIHFSFKEIKKRFYLSRLGTTEISMKILNITGDSGLFQHQVKLTAKSEPRQKPLSLYNVVLDVDDN